MWVIHIYGVAALMAVLGLFMSLLADPCPPDDNHSAASRLLD